MIIEPDISIFRVDRPGVRKVLGNLEADIMEIIWTYHADKGTTVREVFENLYNKRRIAYTSVMSTMTRLAKKHMLRAEKADHAYIYFSNFTREEFIQSFVDHIMEHLLIGFGSATLDRLGKLHEPRCAVQVRQLLEDVP